MSNGRKTEQSRGGLRLVAGRGNDESPRQGNLHAVGGGRTLEGKFPALPETAAGGIHVLTVSLRGTVPPVWRRLEVPSAITLDRLHQVVQEAFGWSGIGRHWFQTACGDFDWIGYRYGYRDEWQADIVVEEIRPATPGVTYPRCTKASASTRP